MELNDKQNVTDVASDSLAPPSTLPPDQSGSAELPVSGPTAVPTSFPQESAAAASTFKLGDVVMCSAGKAKASYDNKRGKIVKVLSQKIRVQLLEGPCQGQEKDYAFDKVVQEVAQIESDCGASAG
eukprot:415323-Amphidinium_carterae.1